jgi:AcrR family transcriptional regulator
MSDTRTAAGDGYHHGNLRAACVEAGMRLVEAGGPDAVTIRGVARLAGVSHTAPLHHFRDRHELLGAVAERGFEMLLERLAASIDPAEVSPAALLRAYGLAYVDHAIQHQGLFQLMFAASSSAPGEAAYRRLIDLCADAQLAGELAGNDPIRLARLLWSTVHGLATLYGSASLATGLAGGQPQAARETAEAALDDLLTALSRRPAGPPTPPPRSSKGTR